MERPIQLTPTITGEDAKRFLRNLAKDLNSQYTPEELEAKRKEYEHDLENYRRLVKATNGVFY
jgi:nitrogenase molybdenum-iron protein alpha/beta subunit